MEGINHFKLLSSSSAFAVDMEKAPQQSEVITPDGNKKLRTVSKRRLLEDLERQRVNTKKHLILLDQAISQLEEIYGRLQYYQMRQRELENGRLGPIQERAGRWQLQVDLNQNEVTQSRSRG